jgi:hypothetical protein
MGLHQHTTSKHTARGLHISSLPLQSHTSIPTTTWDSTNYAVSNTGSSDTNIYTTPTALDAETLAQSAGWDGATPGWDSKVYAVGATPSRVPSLKSTQQQQHQHHQQQEQQVQHAQTDDGYSVPLTAWSTATNQTRAGKAANGNTPSEQTSKLDHMSQRLSTTTTPSTTVPHALSPANGLLSQPRLRAFGAASTLIGGVDTITRRELRLQPDGDEDDIMA